MPRVELTLEDACPRFRAMLTRAGLFGTVSELSISSPEIVASARAIYTEAPSRAKPAAFTADLPLGAMPQPVPAAFTGSRSCAIMLFTLGAEFDEWVSSLLAAGETGRGVMADAWGSEAVEAMASRVDRAMRAVRGEGSRRFAPGYAGCDIRLNADWLAAIARDAPEAAALCRVDPVTGIISPRKSIICGIGWRDFDVSQIIGS